MTDVTLRATKGSPLTHTEMDNNQVATRSGRKNMIIGGNFDTNPWQRGTAFTAPATGDYSADRFGSIAGGSSSAVFDIDKVADAPSVAQAGFLVSNCLSVDVTTADVSVDAAAVDALRYYVEGYDWAQIAQNDFVISFWHKHTKTGTYCVSFRNSGNGRSYVAEYTQSVTDTWEKATIKVTASPSAGTWDYTTGIGLTITFAFVAGTTFHTTADAWQTGNFIATSNQVNAMDSTSNFCRFALIQVEDGIVATDFERRAVGEELALCQRYFQKSFSQGTNPGSTTPANAIRFRAQTTNHVEPVEFPSEMRNPPTMVGYNSNSGATGTWRDNSNSADKSVNFGDIGTSRTRGAVTSSVISGSMDGHWTADAEL